MIRIVLEATALGLAVAADDPKGAGQKELDRLLGDWKMVSGRQDGVDTTADAAKVMVCRVRGTKVTFLREGKAVEEVTITLDPSRQPKEIDATLANKKLAPGIYRLEGDSFTLCYFHPGNRRPTDFTSKAGADHSLSVWKRDK
jgi:uncharacterized protein (TIGR03067 family)